MQVIEKLQEIKLIIIIYYYLFGDTNKENKF